MPFENVAMNTTGSGLNALNTFGSWLPMVIMIIVVSLVVGIIVLAYGSFSRYRKLMGFFGWFGKVCVYFGKGLIGVAFFGSIITGAWMLGQGMESGTIRLDIILMWSGIGLAAFFGVAGFGYLMDKLWKRMMEFHKRYGKVA